MFQVVVVRAGSFVKRKTEVAAAAVAGTDLHVASLVWAPCCPIDEHQWVQTCGAVAEEESILDIVAAAEELGKRQAHRYHNALEFGDSQHPVVVALVGIYPYLVLQEEAWERHLDVVVLLTDK